MDKKTLTKYRRTIQTLRARGRIKSETFGTMGQCQRKKGFTLLEEDALEYLLKEFPLDYKSRDEEIKRLKKDCKHFMELKMSDLFKTLGNALNPEKLEISPIESFPIDTLAMHWRHGDLKQGLWVLCSEDQVRKIEQQNREMLEILKPCDEEIKKLRDALKNIDKEIDKIHDLPFGIIRQNIDKIIKEALKDGE